MTALENFFNPQSIAIVGASVDEGAIGNVIAKNILNLGYAGEVYLVNPKHDEVLGKKCYKGLFELDGKIDLAIIAIPAELVVPEIEKNAGKLKNFVIISAGFSEIGKEGREREEKLIKISREKNLNILGPNCLGFIIPSLKLNASFAGGMPQDGNVAFVSQSGALAVGMMDIFEREGLGFSRVISIGNKMQMDETALLEYLAEDEKTKVIAMYLEGIRDGLKFIGAVEKVAPKKPIVILEAGRTEKAKEVIASHTGALAGSREISEAVFRNCGVMEAKNLEEFLNLTQFISLTENLKSSQVAVVTNAGGLGVLTSDAFDGKEVKLAEIGDEIKNKLAKFLPKEAALDNPIDLLGDASEDRYDKILKVIEKDPGIGSIICVLTPQDQTPVLKIAKKIINFKNKSEKVIVAVFLGGNRVKKAVAKLRNGGIANFSFPEQAVGVLDQYFRWNIYKIFREKNQEAAPFQINQERRKEALNLIDKAKIEGREALYFEEAKNIMKMYNLNVVDHIEIKLDNLTKTEPEITSGWFPVVLKVDSTKILHKTDKEGLILDIKNIQGLEESIAKMKEKFSGERLIIQPMADRKTELIVGIKKDETFGPVIAYGLGGIYTEIFKLVSFMVPVQDALLIEKNLLKSKIGFLFWETRGQKKYDLKEFTRILSSVSALARELPEIREFDMNPVLVYNDGKAAVAVDIKVII